MRPIAFALQFDGEAVALDGGRFWVETRVSSSAANGCAAGLAEITADRAVCRHELELWDDGSLVQTGELAFGANHSVTFRARGALGASPDP